MFYLFLGAMLFICPKIFNFRFILLVSYTLFLVYIPLGWLLLKTSLLLTMHGSMVLDFLLRNKYLEYNNYYFNYETDCHAEKSYIVSYRRQLPINNEIILVLLTRALGYKTGFNLFLF